MLKGETTKSFFPNIAERLKLRINATPNFTAIVNGHDNIKTYFVRVQNNREPKVFLQKKVNNQWTTFYSTANS